MKKLIFLLILVVSVGCSKKVVPIKSRDISTINVGTTANDGTGDPLRTAFIKVNQNFSYHQAQLALKSPLASPTFTGTVILPATTSIGNVSATEISYLDNAASNIQTQLNDTTTLDLNLNAQTGTSYTLVIGDNYGMVTLSNANAITLTVPPNSSVAFPVGANITIVQTGAGQVTVSPGSGVTIYAAGSATKLRVQYSAATLIKTATNTWILVGDITS